MVSAKERLSKQEWKSLIGEWEKSKESQPAFCQRKGISYTSFGYWRTRLKAKPEGIKKASPFKEVKVLSFGRMAEAKQANGVEHSIKVQVGNKLTLIFDASLLGSVLPVLKPMLGE